MPKSNSKPQPRITVIIPVYNCERYIQRCLDSIYAQTFQDFEIIAVNDGSVDDSLRILRQNAKRHKNLKVIDQTNHGQGYTRNQQLDAARGDYIMFVDSDDYIAPLTMELAVTRADQDKSDFVHYDWKLSRSDPGERDEILYYNAEPFAHKDVLIDEECDEFLGSNTFYTVTNLYRRSFLNNHSIRYDEGHIYEDVIFIVKAANRATKISLLHAPLYIVQRNETSTTRSQTNTDRHYRDFMRAVKRSFKELEPRSKYSTFHLAGYLLASFVAYYNKRIPARLRRQYTKDFVDTLHPIEFHITDTSIKRRLLITMIQKRVFVDKRYSLFRTLVLFKLKIVPTKNKLIAYVKQTKHEVVKGSRLYKREVKKPIIENSIVFLGFDHRYTGNSRYLFEEITRDKRYRGRSVMFVTDDELVEEKHRLSPMSDEYFAWIARAETLIAESWIPGNIKKRPESTWVQLWHGTPLKRMLFDSHETSATKRNQRHRIGKYRNIMNWDFLLADSLGAADKFKSAFQYPAEKIITAGYPRVKYLIDNRHKAAVRQRVKKSLGLNPTLRKKKIVLYAPTWRDYNYGMPREQHDYSYVLDLVVLSQELGDDYLVMFHDHHFLSKNLELQGDRCIDVSDYDISELLLMTDYLITDYSSVLFDAFPINLPVIVYTTDYERYETSRGVYGDMWRDLQPFLTDSVTGAVDKIRTYNVNKAYEVFKGKYCYDSKESLADLLVNMNSNNPKAQERKNADTQV